MRFKAEIMDAAAMSRSLARITHEIIERSGGNDGIVLIGIKRRGLPIASKIAENLKKFEEINVPVGYVDITLYRDDLSEEAELPSASDCFMPCDIAEKNVILVDDVIYTGRTARAAIEAVFSYGRPASIQLAVLVDRGHRELPLKPDYVGKNIPTSKNELVSVRISEIDGTDSVSIWDRSIT